MIKKNLEKFIQKFFSRNLLTKNFVSRSAFFLLFAIFLNSCTDQGCIEADDFGEYQTQVLTIPSNAAADSCAYDTTLDLDDSSQGSGLKTCFTSGNTYVTNESNSTQYTSAGCNGYQTDSSYSNYLNSSGTVTTDSSQYVKMDASHINLCVTNCVNSCLNGSTTGSAADPEPNWIATDEKDSSINSGVQILPGSKIIITATGNVTLSDSANYPTFYIPVDAIADNGMQQNYKSSNWTGDNIFDVKAGQSFNMNFSGSWQRPTGTSNLYTTSQIGGGKLAMTAGTNMAAIYDGAVTLAAYTIPHPSGYVYDSSKNDETLGTTGTPLLPNPLTWTCDYDQTLSTICTNNTSACVASLTNSNCYNITNGYSNLGYASSVDTAVLTSSNGFIIKSSGQSDNLGVYGGPIRWTKDGTLDGTQAVFGNNTYKDLTTISSSQYAIPSGLTFDSNNVPLSPAKNIGSTTTSTSIINNDTIPYMFYIKGSCSDASYTTVSASLLDSSGNAIANKTNLTLSLNDPTGWPGNKSPSKITLDPGQTIVITPVQNCGTLNFAVKFHPFKDILIKNSGFVRFTTLNASYGTCTLNGRIINPNDSDGNARSNTDSDFYEYDDFTSTSSIDPLNSLTVSSSSSTLNWSNKVFVRKGQIIRLSPESWNGTFKTNQNLDRQCGIGMVMQIIPRPALLCKGVSNIPTTNPDSNCLADTDSSTGTLIGCKVYASECNDSSNTAYYCPYSDCQDTITCTAGGSPYYQKSCTKTASNTSSSACKTALSGLTSQNIANFQSSCSSSYCSGRMLTNGNLAGKISQTQDACYDLEDYVGRVSNIPTLNGDIIDDSDPLFTKGGKKLGTFNGYYGNFSNFSDTGGIDSSHNDVKIYQSSNIMTFSQDSRLKFMFVTNNTDFRNLDKYYSINPTTLTGYDYASSSSRGSGYTGLNGFKIGFSGSLQFSNGQWLEVRLCRETSTHSCRAATLYVPSGTTGTSISVGDSDSSDIAINAQPHLVELDTPTSSSDTTPNLSSTANYKFDAYGTLTRVTSPSTKDCTTANQAVDTEVDSTFYCHTYLNSTSSYIYDSSASSPFSDSDYTELNKLRLSFKIKDPEVTNCTKTDNTAGIKLTNPAFQSSVCYTGANCIPAGSSYSTACGKSSSSSACTGVISGSTCNVISSSYYDGYFSNGSTVCVSNSINVGQTCTSSDGSPSLSEDNPCKKQFYCGSPYANNSGSYTVTVKVTNPPGSNISNIIGGVITPVIEVMDGKKTIASDGTVTTTVGQSERIYNLVVQDSRYQAILSMCLVVMLTFYGTTYLMGITNLSSSDLINRCIKIALIYLFASPTGWFWFNTFVVKWFKDGTDYLAFMMASSFDSSAALTKAIANNDYYDKSILFSSVDQVFGMFFSQAVQKKISALLFASIFGWVYLWIIYLSFMLYVYAVGYAILYYLTAQIFISLLFLLGPIFFIFTLFNQTKSMFDNWLNQLIGFSLQQIFLLTTLAFFNMMMYEVLKMSLGYRICWDEVWTINIITRITLLSFWTIASLPPSTNTQSAVGDIGHPEGIPSLFSILFIWVVASLMKHFISFMTDLGSTIGGSVKASDMAKGALSAISEFQKFSTDRLNDIKKGTIGEPMKRLDAALFDSGEHAEKARKERQQKNRQDQSKKEALSKAGNEAMSKYKRENAAEFAGLSEEKKKEKLLEAKESGMKAEAKKLGINDEELKRLKSDKGLKYEGSNLLVAAAQAVRQKTGFGGGTLDKSLDEAKIDTKMSYGEAKAGMSKMNESERESFMKQAVKGNVSIGKSTSQHVIGAAQNVIGAAKNAGKTTASIAASGASGAAGFMSDLASATVNQTVKGISGAVLGKENAINNIGNSDFKSTRANLDSAGKALSKGAGAGKDALVNAAKNLRGKAANAAGYGEYNEARKQLEDSGEIRKMATGSVIGTNFLRSDEEKKQIKDKMLQNREAKKTDMPHKNDSMTLAKLSLIDKGMKSEEKKEADGTQTTLGKLNKAVFGAGGMSNAIGSQLEKGKLAEEFSTKITSEMSNGLSEKGGALQQDKARKATLETTKQSTSEASKNIRNVQAAERALANDKSGKTKLTDEQKQKHEATIKKGKENDAVEKGGVGFFQMRDAQEKLSSATTDKEKESAQDDINKISSNENYIELQDGGATKADRIYQAADQELKNVDERISKMEPVQAASQKSAEAFNKAMSSTSVKNAIEDYEALSKFQKATGGGFSGSAREKVRKFKKVEAMKKDYAALGKLSNDDMKLDRAKINKDDKPANSNQKNEASGATGNTVARPEMTSKAAIEHENFAEKYSDGLSFDKTEDRAPTEHDGSVINMGNGGVGDNPDAPKDEKNSPPTSMEDGTELETIEEGDESEEERDESENDEKISPPTSMEDGTKLETIEEGDESSDNDNTSSKKGDINDID